MLQQKFYSFNKCSKDNTAVHISKLRNIVQQFKDLEETISDSILITKILMTLPCRFNSSWESTSGDYQTVDNLTSRLVMEELRLETNTSNDVCQALIAKKYGAAGRLVKCFNCNERGHIKKDCPRPVSSARGNGL